MKKIFLYIAITFGLLSCNHKDSLWQEVVEDLDERVETLEMLCAEMNTNITALQTIVDVLQSNDFITSIVEIKKDGKVVGYTITFGKHDPITIYHGQDGKDGQNGADGKDGQDGSSNTPVIGVAKDTDGVYYWTLNGEWLLDDNGNKLPVTGKDGKDGQDGADGKDGQNGADGKDGQDGITPLLKIEDGYWYISYDNGATWTESGKATGDNGQDGQNGTDGKDGQDGITPLLKIEDGYWYISYDNGATWTESGKATGDNGQDGQNGTDGKDGQDGANGQDGVTPLLKIENGYWYISYDNGATWAQLGKATGEDGKDGADGEDGKDGQNGTDGKDGQDGDSMFQSVTQDENYVYFTLADGTVIKIAKGNNTNGQPNGDAYIDFEDFNVLKALLNMGVDINNDCYITYNEAANVDSLIFTNNTSIYFFREFKYFIGIQYFMFNKCSNLFAINLPEHIKYIDNECFQDCINLKHIQIPESCIKIGDRAFAKCSTLETVNVSTNCTSIGNSAFNSCTNLNNINIPESCIRIGDSIFNGCKSIKNIYIPESCSRIGAYAFNECSSLLGISLPSSVTRIEKYTFNNCSSLKKIDIPNSVYYIAATALTGLGVDTLTFPENYGSELMFDLKNSNLKTIVWNTIAFPTDYHYRDNSGYYHIYEYWGLGGSWKYGNHTNMMNPTYETGVYNSTISTLILGEKVEYLPNSLCSGMKLEVVYSKNIIPPTLNSNGFGNAQTIYVPMESVEKYKSAWAQFADKIVGYDFE